MPIRLLDPDVSSQIAAGEVVERPASVVRELVENSLDAGATEVVVEVAGGGSESIRVVDNGAGIPTDEVELAFQRFATSKVVLVDDLASIETLGFRGEALPSIAAVSKLTLVSRATSHDAGTRIELDDGHVLSVQPQGAAHGTAVTVRRLFKSFPARRKFLRTAATETSRIQAAVTRYAFAYPAVRFKLGVDGSEALSTTGSGDLREAVSSVYGAKTAAEMLEIETAGPLESEDVAVSGLVGPASLARANRGNISLFVNGRWVQSRMLGYALEQAYQGFLMERRYPTAVVHVRLPADQVDVNVHPTKAEVRFTAEGRVFAALQHAVRSTLVSHTPVPEITGIPSPTGAPSGAPMPQAAPFWPTEFGRRREEPLPARPSAAHPGQDGQDGSGAPPVSSAPPTPSGALPTLRVLGQVHDTYVAAEGPEGMYLVDQHAAHERVLFERVRDESISAPPRVQSLLEPAVVQLDPRQTELLETQADLLSQIGFQVEAFGEQAHLLRGVPAALPPGDPTKSLVEVLDLMAEGGGFESWVERAAYSIACHGAVRAGKTLSEQEMEELTGQLEQCEQPHTCPHGRPTMIHLSASHLEREFGRR